MAFLAVLGALLIATSPGWAPVRQPGALELTIQVGVVVGAFAAVVVAVRTTGRR